MARRFGLVYPLWRHGRPPQGLLERAAGEIGLDFVVVPAVSGAVAEFIPALSEAPWFETEGGWHFPPHVADYAAAGFKPRVARWVGTRNRLADLREEAGRLGLELHARVDLAAVPGLAEQAPLLRARDAWGEEQRTAGPCRSTPVFRELLRGTLQDLGRYEPAGVEIVDRGALPAALGPTPAVYGMSPHGRWLRTCFCAACRNAAALQGADAETAAAAVRGAVERLARQPADEALAEWMSETEGPLQQYVKAQQADWHAWLARLAETSPKRRFALVQAEPDAREAPIVAEGAPPGWPVVLALPDLGEESRHWLAEQRERAPQAGCSLGLVGAAPDQLVRLVRDAVEGGVTWLEFARLAESPEETIVGLKQAVRYARRE